MAKDFRKMAKMRKLESYPELALEPLVISCEDEHWLHPHLENIVKVYRDEEKSTDAEAYGPWIEVVLADEDGDLLTVIGRFYDTEGYRKFVKMLKEEKIDGEIITEVSKKSYERVGLMIMSIIFALTEDSWCPDLSDSTPFSESEFAAVLASNFSLTDNLFCLTISPNVAIILE